MESQLQPKAKPTESKLRLIFTEAREVLRISKKEQLASIVGLLMLNNLGDNFHCVNAALAAAGLFVTYQLINEQRRQPDGDETEVPTNKIEEL